MFIPLIVLSILGGALGQVVSVGTCPQVYPLPDFDIAEYLGKWYEAEKFFAIFEATGKCITAEYSEGENGSVKVVNKEISILGNLTIEGTARVPNASEPAKLKVRLNIADLLRPESDYWVLGTDYKNYAVVYSCANLHLLNVQFAWILTRQQNPPGSVIQDALRVASSNHLDTSRFMKTDQKNC